MKTICALCNGFIIPNLIHVCLPKESEEEQEKLLDQKAIQRLTERKYIGVENLREPKVKLINNKFIDTVNKIAGRLKTHPNYLGLYYYNDLRNEIITVLTNSMEILIDLRDLVGCNNGVDVYGYYINGYKIKISLVDGVLTN